jgi:hypothetical protein
VFSPGCTNYREHKTLEDRQIIEEWHLFEAPITKPKDFRNAVAIACHMGVNVWGDKDLIRLTAVDYYSGEILIDNLVWPGFKLLHTNPRDTSITWERLETAHKAGKAIKGLDAARNLLFNFVGDKIILILHDGQEDLLSLRMMHHHIIDVKYFIERGDIPYHLPKRTPELKEMTREFLNRNIEECRSRPSFERAVACRDLTLHFVQRERLPDVIVPEFANLREDIKFEDIGNLWAHSQALLDRIIRPDVYKYRPALRDSEVKQENSGLVTRLERFRVFTPSPLRMVLKDLKGNRVAEDGSILETAERWVFELKQYFNAE